MAQEGKKRYSIEVIVEEDGSFTATVSGIRGKKCSDVTKFLRESGIVEVDQHTPEYYQTDTVTRKVTVG